MRRTLTITLCLMSTLVACSKSETSSGAGTTAPAVTTAAATDVVTTAPATTAAGSTTPDATRPDLTLPGHGTIDPTKPTFSTLPRANSSEGAPGTVSVAITSPVAVAGWGVAPVACSVDRRVYTASFDQAAINETLAVSATIKAVNYTGPGTYPAVGSATILVPSGTYEVPLAANVTIDANLNGTVTISATVESTTVAFTLTWYCS